jgi:hypothetical protein
MAHLSRDQTAPKMGHPIVVVLSDMGQPAEHETSPSFVLISHISTPIHTNLHHSCTLPFHPIAPTLKRCPITDQ